MLKLREMFGKLNGLIESSADAYSKRYDEDLGIFFKSKVYKPYMIGLAVVGAGLLGSALITGNRELLGPGGGLLLGDGILYAYMHYNK